MARYRFQSLRLSAKLYLPMSAIHSLVGIYFRTAVRAALCHRIHGAARAIYWRRAALMREHYCVADCIRRELLNKEAMLPRWHQFQQDVSKQNRFFRLDPQFATG